MTRLLAAGLALGAGVALAPAASAEPDLPVVVWHDEDSTGVAVVPVVGAWVTSDGRVCFGILSAPYYCTPPLPA